MLSIRLNGSNYTNFISAKVYRSIDACVGAFSFTSSANSMQLFPLTVGDRVEILADSQLVLTGYIDDLTARYSYDTHEISVSGRSLLSDLVDSSVKTRKEFSGLNTLSGIARAVLDDLGLTDIEIINLAGTINSFAQEDIASSEIGETAFEFLEKLARKRQVFLNSNENGDLVFMRGTSTTQGPIELRNTLDKSINNIKSAQLKIDHKDRFNYYKTQTQVNPVFASLNITPNDVANSSPGDATDTKIRSTRYLEFVNEESGDTANAYNRAKWEANIRRSRSVIYEALVQGHTFNDQIINPNTLISVKDIYCDINSKMLAKSAEMTYDISVGSETKINLVQPDAYTLQAEQNQREANRNNVGDAF